ncbi:hypothetical protein OJAV_G00107430 [Oryzias javanicus]|uniref:CYRIA/CYRIB Rac1 binding domain-containing protein n=1 Tax=Oryzias javanicus TaxID=123683 RepID=A0A3S2P7I5_ORYJA|nr:hypothetical protein OJAV_G00107430 [Oryzias javanicus]
MAFYFSWTNSCWVQCRGGRGRAVWRERGSAYAGVEVNPQSLRLTGIKDPVSSCLLLTVSSPSIASEKEERGLRGGEREALSFHSARPAGVGADAVTTVRSGHAPVDALKCSSGRSTSEEGRQPWGTSLRGHMGNLLKVLACAELEHGPIVFLDFEHAQPTEAETAVWNQVSAVLEEAHGILAELQSYNGAGQEIREAIQNPGDLALQEKAWNAVCPLVAKLKRFYEFSLRLENALRSLLEALTSPPYAPMQHLEREQALAKQFAEILHFTLSFDELKMTNPAIQNDFSYYRRTISRNRLNNQQLEAENEVNNEMANRMSLFYAEATPMLKTLSNATTKFVSENKTLPIEDTTDCLSTMACVCRVMLETPEYRCRFTNTDTMLFCMRVMVGVIILYDHVHPVGAFAKTSKIDMKGCIKVLKEQPSNSVEGLLNALRYTTRHLNDDSTSKQIRALLQ